MNEYLFILSMVSLWYEIFLKGSHFNMKVGQITQYIHKCIPYVTCSFCKTYEETVTFQRPVKWSIHMMYEQKALYATKVTINVNYYSFNSFCIQANFEQICMHVLITLPENLVKICQVVKFYIYNEKSEIRCNILKLAQTIRAISRWTAALFLASFIRLQH